MIPVYLRTYARAICHDADRWGNPVCAMKESMIPSHSAKLEPAGNVEIFFALG